MARFMKKQEAALLATGAFVAMALDPATSAALIAVGPLLSTIPVDKSVDAIVTSGANPHSTVSIGELAGYWFVMLSC